MATPKRRYAFRRNLPHFQRAGRPLAVTLTARNHFGLSPGERDIVYACCLREHEDGRVLMHTFVVMPNHVHLLFTPKWDEGGLYSLAEIMAGIKGASAHRINSLSGRTGRVWEPEYFDHVVRKWDFQTKFDYIVQNPVAARLARTPRDYPCLWINADCK